MGSRLDSNSNAVRKRIEQHAFENEHGEEYEASGFGGFGDYYRRKKIKLQNLDAERRRQNPDTPQIFRGVVVHVNGYTQPSLNELHAMIVDHGGGFLQYLDSKTMATHIVATNLTPKKAEEFRKYRVVKPAWIVDSIKAGKLLPWSSYRLLDEGSRQNVLGFEGGTVKYQPIAPRQGYRDQMATSWYTNRVKDAYTRADAEFQPRELDHENVASDSASLAEFEEPDNGDLSPERTQVDLQDVPSYTDSFAMSGIDDADLIGMDSEMQISEDLVDDEISQVGQDIGIQEEPHVVVVPSMNKPQILGDTEPSYNEYASLTKSESKPAKNLSAEEHNAMLLADPRIWKSTVVNPGFLKSYYEESRLHHLSTWKAELKSRLQALAQERTASQEARVKRPRGARRYVLHVDFDCFFAAVSLKHFPQYVDKPVVVAHGSGAGAEIASCNYHAREFGIKNGMWMKSVLELCPVVKVLPYDFSAYEAASKAFYTAIMDIGGIVQSVSIDEALVDVSLACFEAGLQGDAVATESSISREQAQADRIANDLRDLIKEETGCDVSVGIGGNILLAKVALRKAKPAGQYQVRPDQILDFIGNLSVRDLPGVAYSIGGKLEELGVKLVKDVRELTKERLMNTLGPKTGEKIWEYSQGIDRAEVGEQVVRKSVSAEVTWGVRFVTQQQADEFVRSLCEELHRRLVAESVKGRQFTMKIMKRAADAERDAPKHLGHGKCDVFNKSSVLGVATNDEKILAREAISILKSYRFSPGELRGIGVQMTKLEPINDVTPLAGGQKRLPFQTAQRPEEVDASDYIVTPKKPDHVAKHPASLAAEKNAERLNTLGTQFILPTQVDATVLAELPLDVRSKLAGPAKSLKKDAKDHKQNTLKFKSRSGSPGGGPPFDVPSASQLDADTLAALPDDIRAEVEAFYKQQQQASPSPIRHALFPPTPQKSRLIIPPMKTATPTKKATHGRGRGGVHAPVDPHSPLLQSSIVPARHSDSGAARPFEEIPPEMLAALPPEIRTEVLAEQRNLRLQSEGGLSIPERRKMETDMDPEEDLRVIFIPPRPEKPTFTAARLTALPELRNAVSEWVAALRTEGPDEEDVETLARYLKQVVLEEANMDKAVAVIKWLVWLVGELEPVEQAGWIDAVQELRQGVQRTVAERGLGAVQFD